MLLKLFRLHQRVLTLTDLNISQQGWVKQDGGSPPSNNLDSYRSRPAAARNTWPSGDCRATRSGGTTSVRRGGTKRHHRPAIALGDQSLRGAHAWPSGEPSKAAVCSPRPHKGARQGGGVKFPWSLRPSVVAAAARGQGSRPPPPPAPPSCTRGRAASQSACVPRGMPGARTGRGSSGQGSHSGGNSEDPSGAVTVWEVVSLLGKLLGTVAALKVVLYLLRVCLAMAWKSGGASHSELIHNLRSKCNPRRVRGNWGRPGLDRVSRAVRNVLSTHSVPAGRLRSRVAPAIPNGMRLRSRLSGPVTHRRRGLEGVRKSPRPLLVGQGRAPPRGPWGEGARHRWWDCHSTPPLARPGLADEVHAVGVGRCWPGLLVWTGTEGIPPWTPASSHLRPHDRPRCLLAFLSYLPRPPFFPLEGDATIWYRRGRERRMRVLSLRMLGEISGADVQWKASLGGGGRNNQGMLSLTDLYVRSLWRSWNPRNDCVCEML